MKVSSTVPGKESGEVSPDSGSQGIKGVDIVYNWRSVDLGRGP